MDRRLSDVFQNSMQEIFTEMTGIELVKQGDIYTDDNEVSSLGVATILNFSGAFKGRFLIDVEGPVALQATEYLFGDSFSNVRDVVVLGVLSEMNNTIAGNAVTKINNAHGTRLMLAPPIVFAGSNVTIAIPRLASVSVDFMTSYGKVKMNLAVEGGGLSER